MAQPRTRRRVTIDLDDPCFDAFAQFAILAYPDAPLSAALREAALLAMGTDPLEATKIAARRSAWLSTARVARASFGRSFAQARDALEAAGVEIDAMMGD